MEEATQRASRRGCFGNLTDGLEILGSSVCQQGLLAIPPTAAPQPPTPMALCVFTPVVMI